MMPRSMYLTCCYASFMAFRARARLCSRLSPRAPRRRSYSPDSPQGMASSGVGGVCNRNRSGGSDDHRWLLPRIGADAVGSCCHGRRRGWYRHRNAPVGGDAPYNLVVKAAGQETPASAGTMAHGMPSSRSKAEHHVPCRCSLGPARPAREPHVPWCISVLCVMPAAGGTPWPDEERPTGRTQASATVRGRLAGPVSVRGRSQFLVKVARARDNAVASSIA